MKEVETHFKEKTLAIDFDGVIHRYSKGFQGLHNAYDPPTSGTREALELFKKQGYRLIIVSSRTVSVIEEWLKKYEMSHYFEEVTNIKQPARYYIDDHAVRFPKGEEGAWEKIINFINEKEGNKNEQ